MERAGAILISGTVIANAAGVVKIGGPMKAMRFSSIPAVGSVIGTVDAGLLLPVTFLPDRIVPIECQRFVELAGFVAGASVTFQTAASLEEGLLLR